MTNGYAGCVAGNYKTQVMGGQQMIADAKLRVKLCHCQYKRIK
jgi:hypothetical protein